MKRSKEWHQGYNDQSEGRRRLGSRNNLTNEKYNEYVDGVLAAIDDGFE